MGISRMNRRVFISTVLTLAVFTLVVILIYMVSADSGKRSLTKPPDPFSKEARSSPSLQRHLQRQVLIANFAQHVKVECNRATGGDVRRLVALREEFYSIERAVKNPIVPELPQADSALLREEFDTLIRETQAGIEGAICKRLITGESDAENVLGLILYLPFLAVSDASWTLEHAKKLPAWAVESPEQIKLLEVSSLMAGRPRSAYAFSQLQGGVAAMNPTWATA